MEPILKYEATQTVAGMLDEKDHDLIYKVVGSVYDKPIKEASTEIILNFTKFELFLDSKPVNTLYSPTQHTQESLEDACKSILDAKKLFE